MAVQITFRLPMAQVINLVATDVAGANYTVDMYGQQWYVTYHRGRNGTYFLCTQLFSMQMKRVHKLQGMFKRDGITAVTNTVEVAEYA